MIARVALPLAAAAAQVAAALVVLGPPGWPAAWEFFASRQPTIASALAASRLIVLAIAMGLLISALVRALRMAARGIAERRRHQTVAGAAMLAVGLLILGAGLSHHMGAPSVVLGNGSVKEASQELAR